MYRVFIRKNRTSVAILLFIVLFTLIQYAKPAFLYKRDGSIRQFGLGSKQKTVVPNWLVALLLAVLSYLFVLYYLAMPKLRY